MESCWYDRLWDLGLLLYKVRSTRILEYSLPEYFGGLNTIYLGDATAAFSVRMNTVSAFTGLLYSSVPTCQLVLTTLLVWLS